MSPQELKKKKTKLGRDNPLTAKSGPGKTGYLSGRYHKRDERDPMQTQGEGHATGAGSTMRKREHGGTSSRNKDKHQEG